ncbi:unnamed protein product [Rhizophagus irregularis]|nr:unnamed protein product [Rhizophagus irregularis]CAB4438014.1 unnamed protein product [Rhizophagus irregularis]
MKVLDDMFLRICSLLDSLDVQAFLISVSEENYFILVTSLLLTRGFGFQILMARIPDMMLKWAREIMRNWTLSFRSFS